MRRTIGIILAGGNSRRMEVLSDKRAISAMPIAGSYRSIDFALSNMSNSRIQKVAVFTQYNSRLLNEHLNSSKWWDFGRKQGGLFVFTPTITPSNADWYKGTIDALYQNITYLERSHEAYVVIAAGDGVYKLDYEKVVSYHIDEMADVTVVCKRMDVSEEELQRFGVVNIDETGRIVGFQEKPIKPKSNIVSCGIYVIRRRLLIDLLKKSVMEGRRDFVADIVMRYMEVKKIQSYMLEGYWKNIATNQSYYETNMDFLKKDVRDYFLKSAPPIFSKSGDLPPAKYNPGAAVKNSLISSGCIIEGTVENSIIFQKVNIGKGCVIRNSIILNDVIIGENCVIENCIVESRDTIGRDSSYIGEPGKVRVVVEKSLRYPESI